MWDLISQIGIFTFGVVAIFLIAIKNKWGFVIGLLSQPFWFMTAWINDQWAVFLLSIIYMFNWGLGIYTWFYKDKKSKDPKSTN